MNDYYDDINGEKAETGESGEQLSKLEVYRRMLEKAEDIDACEKVAAFEPDGQHNYLFISYSHKDYKQVYSDIANLRFAGVRVWYDEGLSAGVDWREEVKKHLADPCCSGVIFYLSENLFTSQSILYEVQLVQGKKPYFSVNLTDRQPSQILKSCISRIDSHTDDMEWLHHLSGTFKDSATYLNHSGISHDENILRQVRRQFNVTIDTTPEEQPGRMAPAEETLAVSVKKSTDIHAFLINDGVLGKYIGHDAEVIVPDSVTKIGDCAFRNCTELQICVLPDSVTRIGSRAFEGCSGLKSIHIPEGVSDIESYAFAGCVSLASIRIPESVSAISSYMFSGCRALKDLVLPDELKHLSGHAFENCSELANVRIPNGVRSIGDYTFSGCSELQGIVIPNGVYDIGSHAFAGCRSLQGASIPDSVNTVGDYAFAGCEALSSLAFPGYMQEIGEAAFRNCSNLSYFDISISALTEIKKATFENCRKLTQIDVGFSVESIGDFAFKGCNALKSISLPGTTVRIGMCAFGGCFNLVKIDMPPMMESIGSGAFLDCWALSEIKLPQGILEIGDETFSGCGELTNVTVPESVAAIGQMAFGSCKGLREIFIPDGVTTIAGSAFRGSRQVTIHTAKGSCAHKFARRHWLRVQCYGG